MLLMQDWAVIPGPGNKKVSILDGIKNLAENKNIEITLFKRNRLEYKRIYDGSC